MSGSNFDLIAQELLRQQQVMEQMEEENEELRHQLAELREGYGIFVEIDGRRFSLQSEDIASVQTPTVEAIPATKAALITRKLESQAEPLMEPVAVQHDITQDQTEELVMNIPETPRPTVNFFTDDGEVAEQTTGPTFLEEVMLDEFASAATSPLSVWICPQARTREPVEAEADEELAVLRRQLIGSYLLE